MHTYIDINKLYDFSEKLTCDDVSADFDKYHIHNIAGEDGSYFNFDYEEYRYYLEEALFDDYDMGLVNYRAYIEDGMDARFMMELRKSALIRVAGDELLGFYAAHSDCETVADVKALRMKWLGFLNKDYQDLDWQVYMMIRFCWGIQCKDLAIDYEECFADGDWRKQSNPEIYRQEWLRLHLPPDLVSHIKPRY